jgi:hypothetical protein
MTMRQAGAPLTDENLKWAATEGGMKNLEELSSPTNKAGPWANDAKCRLYPKLSFFFDGTGNNLDIDAPLRRLSNVAKLYRASFNDRTGKGASPTYIPAVGTPFKVPKLVG